MTVKYLAPIMTISTLRSAEVEMKDPVNSYTGNHADRRVKYNKKYNSTT